MLTETSPTAGLFWVEFRNFFRGSSSPRGVISGTDLDCGAGSHPSCTELLFRCFSHSMMKFNQMITFVQNRFMNIPLIFNVSTYLRRYNFQFLQDQLSTSKYIHTQLDRIVFLIIIPHGTRPSIQVPIIFPNFIDPTSQS